MGFIASFIIGFIGSIINIINITTRKEYIIKRYTTEAKKLYLD